MSEAITIIIATATYKIVSLLVGLVFCYFGYKLFLAGVWGNAGDLNAKFNNSKIVLKSAAPGTFFAFFGTIVIALTIWKGLDLEHTELKSFSEAPTTAFESLPPVE
jgi:hypothetical protein